MYLKYNIKEAGKPLSGDQYFPVADLNTARKMVDYLMDNSTEKKSYEGYQVVDKTKAGVIKTFDREELRRDQQYRQQKQRRLGPEKGKGLGLH